MEQFEGLIEKVFGPSARHYSATPSLVRVTRFSEFWILDCGPVQPAFSSGCSLLPRWSSPPVRVSSPVGTALYLHQLYYT